MPQIYYPTVPFPLDHAIARQHGGATDAKNLTLSCLHCNSHKGPNIAGLDPRTGKLASLFNPRRHRWTRHFRWSGSRIIARTPIGRVTVVVLAMNLSPVLEVRETLIREGVFPPA
jgi:hypothetical protein